MEESTPLQSITGETDLSCTSSHEAYNAKRPWSPPQVTRHAGQQTAAKGGGGPEITTGGGMVFGGS